MNPNRARDHLANERTFLAWMRTSLALLGFGAVLVRLRFLLPADLQGHTHGSQLGLAFGVAGLLLVPLSLAQLLSRRRSIDRDTFESGIALALIFSAAVFLLGIAVLGFVFATPTQPLPIKTP